MYIYKKRERGERERVLGRQRETGSERKRDVSVFLVTLHMYFEIGVCGQRVSEAERRERGRDPRRKSLLS